jgi:hypothetical protein
MIDSAWTTSSSETAALSIIDGTKLRSSAADGATRRRSDMNHCYGYLTPAASTTDFAANSAPTIFLTSVVKSSELCRQVGGSEPVVAAARDLL